MSDMRFRSKKVHTSTIIFEVDDVHVLCLVVILSLYSEPCQQFIVFLIWLIPLSYSCSLSQYVCVIFSQVFLHTSTTYPYACTSRKKSDSSSSKEQSILAWDASVPLHEVLKILTCHCFLDVSPNSLYVTPRAGRERAMTDQKLDVTGTRTSPTT